MGIGVTNAHAENAMALDHDHNFVVRCNDRAALGHQKGNHTNAISQAAKRQLADYDRVAKQTVLFNNPSQLCVAMAKMVNPDRGIR